MNKIISFSLWGNSPKYLIGALENAKLRKTIYPDWECVFYIQHEVDSDLVKELQSIKNTQTIIVEAPSDWRFATERFRAIDDADASHIIFRDTDSRLNEREAEAVNEWIKKDSILHIMRDHPYHGSFPILAGMWGFNKKKEPITNLLGCLNLYRHYVDEQYHYDQIFLQNYFWDRYKDDATIHDEFFSKNPFPSERVGNQFVGQSFDERGDTPIEHIASLFNP